MNSFIYIGVLFNRWTEFMASVAKNIDAAASSQTHAMDKRMQKSLWQNGQKPHASNDIAEEAGHQPLGNEK